MFAVYRRSKETYSVYQISNLSTYKPFRMYQKPKQNALAVALRYTEGEMSLAELSKDCGVGSTPACSPACIQ